MNTVTILALIFLIIKVETRSIRFKRDLQGPEAELCIRELNLDKAEIEEINKLHAAPENHQHYMEFMECLWKKNGYLMQNGNIDLDKIKKMLDDSFEEDLNSGFGKNIADIVYSKCKNIEGILPGQKVVKMKNCITKNLQEVIDQ